MILGFSKYQTTTSNKKNHTDPSEEHQLDNVKWFCYILTSRKYVVKNPWKMVSQRSGHFMTQISNYSKTCSFTEGQHSSHSILVSAFIWRVEIFGRTKIWNEIRVCKRGGNQMRGNLCVSQGSDLIELNREFSLISGEK